MSLLVLSRTDVEKVAASFSTPDLEALMARVFNLLSSQHPGSDPVSYNPARLSFPAANHTALFMPARIAHSSLSGATCKIVCVPRASHDQGGLPGSTVVLDNKTGAVKAIVNARALTALRNAAGVLVSCHKME